MNATEDDLKRHFVDRAKSLAKLKEVYRSPQVTLLVSEALACGLRFEAEIFEAAYGDSVGQQYWKAQLSEPLPVYKLARVLAVHIAENAQQIELATSAIIMAFRDAAVAGEDYFVGDTQPLQNMEDGSSNFAALRKTKIRPGAAVDWLLSKPKRECLVPESLRRFLHLDYTVERLVTEDVASRFVEDYVKREEKEGRRATVVGLDAAAIAADLRGARDLLRRELHRRVDVKRGRPTKAPKIAKK
jgi:hypothetical protein